jgi:hypothetical protein
VCAVSTRSWHSRTVRVWKTSLFASPTSSVSSPYRAILKSLRRSSRSIFASPAEGTNSLLFPWKPCPLPFEDDPEPKQNQESGKVYRTCRTSSGPRHAQSRLGDGAIARRSNVTTINPRCTGNWFHRNLINDKDSSSSSALVFCWCRTF